VFLLKDGGALGIFFFWEMMQKNIKEQNFISRLRAKFGKNCTILKRGLGLHLRKRSKVTVEPFSEDH